MSHYHGGAAGFLGMTAVPNVANALQYPDIVNAPDTVQAVADYLGMVIAEPYYSIPGLLANAHTWVFMGMTENQFRIQAVHYVGIA